MQSGHRWQKTHTKQKDPFPSAPPLLEQKDILSTFGAETTEEKTFRRFKEGKSNCE